MEEEIAKEQEHRIIYKIMPDKKYRVLVSKNGNKKYYKIEVSQKEYDGQTKKYYKQIYFKKGIDIENGTYIIIEEAYENLYTNKNDKYNPISALNIIKFRIDEESAIGKAISEYNKSEFDDEIFISDDFLD